MSSPTWSVTIPTYNAAAYLEETLNSVLVQDLGVEEMEIIIVDNGSTDSTLDIAGRVGKNRIRIVINERNVGPNGNFNRCIEVSKGRLLHILHADDLIKMGFYKQFESVFAPHPEVSLVCCNAEIIDGKGRVTGQTTSLKSLATPANDLSEILYKNPMPAPCVVVRRQAYDQIGGFDVSFSHVADWDMWTRLIYNKKGLYIEDVLAQYRMHSNNDTAISLSTGVNVLDFEKIYNSFISLKYPIDADKAFAHLVSMAKDSYVKLYYAGNKTGISSMLSLLRRHISPSQVQTLILKTKIRRRLGMLKSILYKPFKKELYFSKSFNSL